MGVTGFSEGCKVAAMVHDLLWRAYAAKGRMSYVDADGVFRRAMRELEVPFLRRWIMWAAVRRGALVKTGGRKGWLGEAWRVLLASVVALPSPAARAGHHRGPGRRGPADRIGAGRDQVTPMVEADLLVVPAGAVGLRSEDLPVLAVSARPR